MSQYKSGLICSTISRLQMHSHAMDSFVYVDGVFACHDFLDGSPALLFIGLLCHHFAKIKVSSLWHTLTQRKVTLLRFIILDGRDIILQYYEPSGVHEQRKRERKRSAFWDTKKTRTQFPVHRKSDSKGRRMRISCLFQRRFSWVYGFKLLVFVQSSI